METHLGRCPACRQELASLRATVSLLRRLPQAPVPRSFVLREAPAPVSLRRPLPAPLAVAAAAASLFLAFLLAGDALDLWEARAVPAPLATASPEAEGPAALPSPATPTPGASPTPSQLRALTLPGAVAEKGAAQDEPAPPSGTPPPQAEAAAPAPTAPAVAEAVPSPAAAPAGPEPARPGWLRPLELSLAGLTALLLGLLAYRVARRRRTA